MAAALQSYHDTRCFLQKIEDLEYKVTVLEDNKRALMDALEDCVYHSQPEEQSSKSVAAAEAAQEAARKACTCEAADLQYEAAQSYVRACGELKKVTELFSEAGPAAGVLILVHCDTACQQAVSALP